MANLNDVLQGLVNLNSKMANNINSMLDSIGEGFLDVGEISFNGNTITLSNAVVLVNGSNRQVPNLSATFTGNQICFLEFKADKSFALKLVSVTDANFNYNSSSLTSTSKHFAVARRYGSVIEDVRVIGMVSDDKTIVGALNGALKAIDLDSSADLELNLDILSRISALETNKVDRNYVTNYVATTIKDKVDKSYVDDNFVTKTDNDLATTDKTIVGAINELFQCGNKTRQTLVDHLVANNIDASTDDTLNDLFYKLYGLDIDIKKIACSSTDAYVLSKDGYLWGTGYNNFGQLGLGHENPQAGFTLLPINNVKDIACGQTYILVLKNDNTLWGTGNNYYGQLGVGDDTNRNVFTDTGVTNVKSIDCGVQFSIILKDDNTIWGAGSNGQGHLGQSSGSWFASFKQLTTVTDIKSFACGAQHAFIIREDGTLWGTGQNIKGQLGLGDTDTRTSFTKVTTIDNIKEVRGGYHHSMALSEDGKLYTCGDNSNGALGLGDYADRRTFTRVAIDNIRAIACGPYSSAVLKTDGSLYVCGYNNAEGHIGLGDLADVNNFTFVISNVYQVTPSLNKTFILNVNNKVYSTGKNVNYHLGFTDSDNRYTFTHVPYEFITDNTGGSSPITSYTKVTLSSSDLVQSGDYYHYSIESYDLTDVRFILADVKAIDDDIGFTQYYSTIVLPPDSPVGEFTSLVGNYNGNGEKSVTVISTYDSVPIMKTTDNFISATLTIFHRAGVVSNSFSRLLLSDGTTQYTCSYNSTAEYTTVDLNSIPGKFDYIYFTTYGTTNDADSCNINIMYDCNSKKCYYLIQGYYNYGYQFEDVPSNAIPILRADLSTPLDIYYIGFIANNSTIG